MAKRRGANLRIGLIAPPWLRVPPNGYGGIERIVSALRSDFVELLGEGSVEAFTFECVPELHRRIEGVAIGDEDVEEQYVARAYEVLNDCDVISDHSLLGATKVRTPGVPVVATMHGPMSAPFIQRYERMASVGAHLIAVSSAQAAAVPFDARLTVVPNGVNAKEYQLSRKQRSEALFLGRIHPEKAPHRAIAAARAANIPLTVAGPVRGRVEKEYFREFIAPLLGSEAVYVGEVSGAYRTALLASAKVLLAPNWRSEPFGLVVVEALMAGTPVVASPFGASMEAIVDGVNGYVVNNWDSGAPAAIVESEKLSQYVCRESVCERFSSMVMARGYADVFSEVCNTALME
ncbi:glycosyltransferase [Pseudonocardia alni]|uniref:glycosyltransferase n=1 Tax=Pseudonocardia alni TaxID=33907 RepID=UPI001AD72DBA|nr:glycosyltransferase [Pseudonocardia alni]MBO4236827.1 glycosyltransferase [Pseudonocardia alni]